MVYTDNTGHHSIILTVKTVDNTDVLLMVTVVHKFSVNFNILIFYLPVSVEVSQSFSFVFQIRQKG